MPGSAHGSAQAECDRTGWRDAADRSRGGGGAALHHDHPRTSLTVGWGDREGAPGCTYDASTKKVTATITLDGYQPRALAVTVIVTAYADENTSIAVGTGGRTVKASGRVHQRFTLSFGVDRPPHVGEDAVAACGRTVSRELFSAGPVVAGFRRS